MFLYSYNAASACLPQLYNLRPSHDAISLLKASTAQRLVGVTTSKASQVLHLVHSSLRVLRGHVWEKAAHDNEDEEERNAEDDKLGHGRVSDAVVGPLFAESTKVFLELVGSELVVDETAESDAVAEELERGDGVTEDEHGGEDEEDVLEDSGQGVDDGVCLSELWKVVSDVVRVVLLVTLTSRTTETFKKNATMAFARRTKRPTL
jgi:hypothetical protein